jgi:hypothetical protein
VFPVIELGVTGDFSQIPAHQRKMMMLVHLADSANSRHDGLVTQLPPQGIARIGWINDYAPGSYDGSGLSYQAQLWIIGVNGKELGHVSDSC